MSQSPFPGPIAPENNPPINPQYYQPSQFNITAISEGATTTVTTAENHNYVIGQIVRLLIPFGYGVYQLNQMEGNVILIPAANEVTLNINSIGFDSFNPSPGFGTTKPQIVAVGDYNSGQINVSGRTQNITYVNGSFINISPA